MSLRCPYFLKKDKAMGLMEEVEMELESEELSRLSAERMRLKVRLDLVEQEIRSRSKHFYVGGDGLLEVNFGQGVGI